ncbi:ankyrin [Histomonas meleagridis]|uniref:ankyrin n=1 Tax=Histomonas meleagridis TaxID=135588 RepID=UPI0035597BCB|nr:ankyrin [Histomonas meleagridis]KAH0800736.1 ankyrin [Histomonas meleagridis]
MEKNDYSILPDALKPYAELEDLIFDGSEESLSKAQKIIDEVGQNVTKTYLLLVTILAGSSHDKKIREYAEFLKKNGPYDPSLMMPLPFNFVKYIVLSGVLTREQYEGDIEEELKDFKFEWEPNSIQDLIVKGDKKALGAIEDLSDIEVTLFGGEISLMEFALRFGSYEICEYLVKERGLSCDDFQAVVFTRDFNKFKLFENQMKTFGDDEFQDVILFSYLAHAPYIANYIIENYGCSSEEYKYHCSITGYNTVDWYKQIKDLPTYDEKIIKYLVASSQIHVIKYFLNQTPDKIKLEDSAFQAAGKFGDIETIKFMMSTKEYQINKEKCLQMLLKGALKGKESKATEYLIDNGAKLTDELMFFALYEAIYWQEEKFLQFLIDKYHAKLNMISDENETLLKAAAKDGNNEMCERILESGVNINHQDIYGYTALMYAVDAGKTETVKFLIEKGANLNLQNAEGNTAVMLACKSEENIDIIKMLFENDADFNIVNKYGKVAHNFSFDEGLTDLFSQVVEYEDLQQKKKMQNKEIEKKNEPKPQKEETEPPAKDEGNKVNDEEAMKKMLGDFSNRMIQMAEDFIIDALDSLKYISRRKRASVAKHVLEQFPEDTLQKITPSLYQKIVEASNYVYDPSNKEEEEDSSGYGSYGDYSSDDYSDDS